jgi:primosomal protein N' (replication factor Y)
MIILRIALAVPLHRLFDYLWLGTAEPVIGQRVRVPFGSRERIGVVVEIASESAYPPAQLKSALALLDDIAPLPPDFMALC